MASHGHDLALPPRLGLNQDRSPLGPRPRGQPARPDLVQLRLGKDAESPPIAHDPARSFAIIGAGASGLCFAKHLVQAGFQDVTIFEIGTQIGGLWCYENDSGLSSAYKTLHINTARNLTNFSDFPFKPDVQMFPDHRDMHRYLVDYADRFDLTRRIRFRSRVVNLAPAEEYSAAAPRWIVETEDGRKQAFDRVVVATGHLSTPFHVDSFRRGFAGRYLHSHDYREPAPFVGQRICVVGVGNSAVDIASDVCPTAERTVLVARSGVMIGPKIIFGIPFTDLTMKLYRPWIPDRLRRALIRWLVHVVHGPMTSLGFKALDRRAHPTTSAVVTSHIAYRRILVKLGIDRIEGQRIIFADGSSDEFDVLIAATGYLIDLPFLPQEVLAVNDNSVDLYRRIVPPGWAGLYFAGFFNTTTALNYVFEHQARWVCKIETGRRRLPPVRTMLKAVDEKKAWIARFYKDSVRHTIEEEHMYYVNELAETTWRRRVRAHEPA